MDHETKWFAKSEVLVENGAVAPNEKLSFL